MTEPHQSSFAADLIPSVVRTTTPLIIGPLVAYFGFSPDDEATLAALSGLLGWAFYVIIRVLEWKAPVLGWLLGFARQPTYVTPPALVTDEEGTRMIGETSEQ